MALKKNTSSRTRKAVEKVAIRATDGDTIIKVSTETAEMMLRSKGDYELVDETGQAVSKKAKKKSSKKGNADATGADTGKESSRVPEKPVWPAGTAAAWTAYATHLGVATDGLDRSGIRDAVEAHEAQAAQPQ